MHRLLETLLWTNSMLSHSVHLHLNLVEFPNLVFGNIPVTRYAAAQANLIRCYWQTISWHPIRKRPLCHSICLIIPLVFWMKSFQSDDLLSLCMHFVGLVFYGKSNRIQIISKSWQPEHLIAVSFVHTGISSQMSFE